MHKTRSYSLPLLCTLLVMYTLPGQAKVIKASLKAVTATNRATCPATIKFQGTITTDAPGAVTYIFTRSDGALDTNKKTLVFKTAGTRTVDETWTLGGPGLTHYKGWEALKSLGTPEVTSDHADFELFCDPPLNSAVAAHGNTDWHIDTANEFLFGTDMSGHNTATNHAPDNWTKRHIHVGLTNTSKFYYDKEKTATGADTDQTNGIENTMLFFYAGHGNPTIWNTLGDSATQGQMKLANVLNGGMLRYFWQCSCETFAHGPSNCGPGASEYSCPQNFNGAADSAAMRNVFQRWGPVLSSDLRMACGVSTLAYCHEGNVNHIWQNYNGGMSVAESFIQGLGTWPSVVPICITLGGADIHSTPLYDAQFTNKPNLSGSTHYHVMYATGTGTQHVPLTITIPKVLPVYKLVAAEIPPGLKVPNLATLKSATAAHTAFLGGRMKVQLEPASGAIHMAALQAPSVREQVLQQRAYVDRSKNLIRSLGWDEKELGEAEVSRLMTGSMPVTGGQVQQNQKAVSVTYRRQIQVGADRIPVLGDGGAIHMLLSNSGSVVNASRVWRRVSQPSAPVPVKQFDQARQEAERQLGNADAYKLDQWRWGYKEMGDKAQQDEMKVVYQFAFAPKDSKDLLQYPPRVIEIAAQ